MRKKIKEKQIIMLYDVKKRDKEIINNKRKRKD